jgi:hypothetical protein
VAHLTGQFAILHGHQEVIFVYRLSFFVCQSVSNFCYFEDCTDDFSNFLISCDQPEVVRDPNGVCYNYSGTTGATPIGWWNMEKRIEFKKPVLPSEDFFK